MIRCTLFDYNGVLIDDELVHFEAFQEVLDGLGVTLSQAEYWEKYLGFDDVGAFEAILADRGKPATAEQIGQLVQQKMPCYLRRAESALVPFEGAAELIRAQASLGPAGIVSGALRPEIELGLRRLGCEGEIQFIVSAEDTAHSKPDPAGYLKGLEQLRALVDGPLAPAEVLVIEDSISGIQAAKAARLPCVAVAHSYSERELIEAGADAVVAHISKLNREYLAALFNR